MRDAAIEYLEVAIKNAKEYKVQAEQERLHYMGEVQVKTLAVSNWQCEIAELERGLHILRKASIAIVTEKKAG